MGSLKRWVSQLVAVVWGHPPLTLMGEPHTGRSPGCGRPQLLRTRSTGSLSRPPRRQQERDLPALESSPQGRSTAGLVALQVHVDGGPRQCSREARSAEGSVRPECTVRAEVSELRLGPSEGQLVPHLPPLARQQGPGKGLRSPWAANCGSGTWATWQERHDRVRVAPAALGFILVRMSPRHGRDS